MGRHGDPFSCSFAIRWDAVAPLQFGRRKLLRMLARSEDELNRGAFEAEYASQLVFQVAFVREVDILGIVGEKDKGWRLHVGLGGVVELDPFAGLARGRVGIYGLFDKLV